MMRTIKFRAWDKSTKRFWDPPPLKNFIYFDLSTVPDFIGQTYIDDSNKFKERFEISQFTGLEDKNGTDIYECDIVSSDLSRPYLIVEFRNGAFMYQCHDNGEDYYDFMEPANGELKFSTKYHEVIGNTYEHPELLEERVEE